MAALTDIGTLIAQTLGIRGRQPQIAGTGVSISGVRRWAWVGRGRVPPSGRERKQL
jgi:hypothetical protein